MKYVWTGCNKFRNCLKNNISHGIYFTRQELETAKMLYQELVVLHSRYNNNNFS